MEKTRKKGVMTKRKEEVMKRAARKVVTREVMRKVVVVVVVTKKRRKTNLKTQCQDCTNNARIPRNARQQSTISWSAKKEFKVGRDSRMRIV